MLKVNKLELRTINSFFNNKHNELLGALREHKRWTVNKAIQADLLDALALPQAKKNIHAKLIEKIAGEDRTTTRNDKLFDIASSPMLAKLFCRLKIRECLDLLARGQGIEALTPVYFFILEHCQESQEPIQVTVAKLEFDQNHLAMGFSSGESHVTRYNSVMNALQLSDWSRNHRHATIIRFADRAVEERVIVKEYCKEIPYTVLSSGEQTYFKKSIALNFWERFAIERKRGKLQPDETRYQIQEIKAEIQKRLDSYTEIPLDDYFTKLAKPKEEIDQLRFLQLALRNYSIGLASHLRLPTGYGKTFIMLMLMLKHRQFFTKNERKPIMVVVPKSNVRESWRNNLEIFKSLLAQLPTPPLVAKNFSYQIIDDTTGRAKQFECLLDNTDLLNQQFVVVVSKQTLALHFKNILARHNNAFSKSEKELLIAAEILLGEKFITGRNAQEWKNKIMEVLKAACIPQETKEKIISFLPQIYLGSGEISRENKKSSDEIATLALSHDEGEEEAGGKDEDSETSDSEHETKEEVLPEDKFKQFIKEAHAQKIFVDKLKELGQEELKDIFQNASIERDANFEVMLKNLFYRLQQHFNYEHLLHGHSILANQQDKKPHVVFDRIILKSKTLSESGLFKKLRDLRNKQILAEKKYLKFVNSFSGVFVDETEYVLSMDATDGNTSVKDIVMDLSDYYQTQNLTENRGGHFYLVVGASATPWPNSIKQIEIHLQFLAPHLLGENIFIQRTLFAKWETLEKLIKENITQEFSRAIILKFHQEYEVVESMLFEWVWTIFNAAILKVDSQTPSPNNIEERFLEVEYKDHAEAQFRLSSETGKDNVMGMIDKFYAKLLFGDLYKKYNKKNAGKDRVAQLIKDFTHEDKSNEVKALLENNEISTLLSNIFCYIKENQLLERANIAFYINEHIPAIFLGELIEHFYATNGYAIEPVLYYDEQLIKKFERNNNRERNKNTFNNEFCLQDYFGFIDKRFVLKRFKRARIKPLVDQLYRQILRYRGYSHDEHESKELKSEGEESVLSTMSEIIEHAINDGEEPSCEEVINRFFRNKDLDLNQSALKADIISFLDCFWLCTEFERSSKSQAIKLDDPEENWLNQFAKFIPSDIRCTLKAPHEQFQNFRRIVDDDLKGNNLKYFTNLFQYLQHSLIYYLHKMMYLTRVFIFGMAATSGMRIDADFVFLISGAWNEGRMTQIKGRFGRVKSTGRSRKCIIIAPLTDSYFEVLLLKYYGLKAIYDRIAMATSRAELEEKEVLSQLILCHSIYVYYSHIENESIHYPELFNIVRHLQKDNPELYFTCTPYNKALYIVPEEWQGFHNSFREEYDAFITVVSQAKKIEFQTRGREFSALIEQYARNQGWIPCRDHLNQGNASDVVLALHPMAPSLTAKTLWSPTDILVEKEFYLKGEERQPPVGTTLSLPPVEPCIPINTMNNLNEVIIDEKIFDAFKTELYTFVQKDVSDNKTYRYTHRTKIESYSLVGKAPDEFFVEINFRTDLRDQISEIKIQEPLTVDIDDGNKESYSLFGYIAGGIQQGLSHYYTMRKGVLCYYICDDLKGIQKIEENSMPINAKAALFRFVKKSKLDQLLTIEPINLINNNSNCFVHAAFQLIDSYALRRRIDETKFEVPSLERKPTASDPQATKTMKPIPRIEPHSVAQWQDEEIRSVFALASIKSPPRMMLLILPTRGGSPDLSLSKFFAEFLSCLLKSSMKDFKVIAIYGLNEEKSVGKLEEKIITASRESQSLMAHYHSNLYIKITPFIWSAEDGYRNKIPLGQMRNFCLSQAHDIWHKLVDERKTPSEQIMLLSMDADTIPREETLNEYYDRFCHGRSSRRFPARAPFIFTPGYELPTIDPQVALQESAKWLLVNKKDIPVFWTALSSHISMNVNEGLAWYRGRPLHIGYPAEPFLMISPALTTLLFQKTGQYHHHDVYSDEYSAAFGFWDFEGRRFSSFLAELCQKSGVLIYTIGTSSREKRVLLMNYKRFLVAPPPFLLKPKVSLAELSEAIQTMVEQPQHAFHPYSMGANIYCALRGDATIWPSVREHLKYFYVRNVVFLLRLGPERAMILAEYLKQKFILVKEEGIDKETMPKILGHAAEKLVNYCKNSFKVLSKETVPYDYKSTYVRWLYVCSHQLKIIYNKYCTDELDESNRPKPMFLVEDYPRRASAYFEEEEKKQEKKLRFDSLSRLKPLLSTTVDIVGSKQKIKTGEEAQNNNPLEDSGYCLSLKEYLEIECSMTFFHERSALYKQSKDLNPSLLALGRWRDYSFSICKTNKDLSRNMSFFKDPSMTHKACIIYPGANMKLIVKVIDQDEYDDSSQSIQEVQEALASFQQNQENRKREGTVLTKEGDYLSGSKRARHAAGFLGKRKSPS